MQKFHIDFIVGRGRRASPCELYLPLDPKMNTRNIIYIARGERSADVNDALENIDFTIFGICNNQKNHQNIHVRFLFDWASFYCGAVQNFKKIAKHIGRPFIIMAPLSKSESSVPNDAKAHLRAPRFVCTTVEGQYPLFDWTTNDNKLLELINSHKYMLIFANIDRQFHEII